MRHVLVTLVVGLCAACELGGAVGTELGTDTQAQPPEMPAPEPPKEGEEPPPTPPVDVPDTDAGVVDAGDAEGDAGEGTPPAPTDLCPDNPLKSAPGPCGCSVLERDLDSDGLEDCNDDRVAAPLPYVSGAGTSAVLSDGLHYLGGASDYFAATRYRSHHVYDPATGVWSNAPADVPDDDTWGARAHVYQDRLYLLGGYPGANRLRVYDPTTNEWTTLRAPTEPLNWGFASGVIGDGLYAFGGEAHGNRNAPGIRYDFAADQWSDVADIPLNYRRGALASAVVGNRLFVLNGNNDDDETELQIYDAGADDWSEGAVLDGHVFEAAAAVADANRVLFFGGAANQDIADSSSDAALLSDRVNVYDTLTDSWSQGAPLSTPRMWSTAQLFDGRYFVLGGLDASSNEMADYEVLAR